MTELDGPRHEFYGSVSRTVPDEVGPRSGGSCSKSDGRPTAGTDRARAEMDPYVGAMRRAMAPAAKAMPRGLKHSVLSVVAEDAELSARCLEHGLDETIVEAASRVTLRGLKHACKAISNMQKVLLVFVVDTTGSMGGVIGEIKRRICDIVQSVCKANCHLAGVAFVGYKDWSDGSDHFEVLDFTRDVSEFQRFVGGITAGGGGDAPEDVLGGVCRALELSWPEEGGSRVLFHIGDAPHHGRVFHSPSMGDDYPDGHPSDPSVDDLFRTRT